MLMGPFDWDPDIWDPFTWDDEEELEPADA